nr:hypothetical protein [Tanacetum cinerariifolium]
FESKEMRECCFVVKRDAWLRGEFTLSSLDVLQGFSFFLQMGFTLILATLDGLDGFFYCFVSSTDQRKVPTDGEDLLCNFASSMNRMRGKGDAGVSQPRMLVRVTQNPKSGLIRYMVSEGPIHDHMDSVQAKGSSEVKAPNDPNVDDNPPGMVSPSEPIVQSVDINTKSTSYAGAAGESTKEQPKVNSNFRPLVADLVFNDVNISIPRKVVEKMIRNTLIILKKWPMGTSLLKEELTRIAVWVKLHDVPLQVFEEDGRSCFARCLIKVNSKANLVDVVTIGIHSLTMDDFTKETIHVENEWRPPRCDICKIFGHIHEHCPKKMKKKKDKFKSTNGGQFAGPSIKQNIRYDPKATTSAPKKRTTNVSNASKSTSMLKTIVTSLKNDNIITSNAYSALNDEEEEVENVYDESANLFLNINTGGSSSFTVVAGSLV